MKYISTRGNYQEVEAAETIRLGMVPAGGLFVPEEIPEISLEEIKKLKTASYQEIAFQVLSRFLTDFTEKEIIDSISNAYNRDNFNVQEICPVINLTDNIYVMELWHGPTAAFKDMALQLMPHLLSRAIDKVNIDKEMVILVATSGDTGKAALEGFKNVKGVKIIVFYPETGVSKIQETQMVTTGGNNTAVVGVKGNFDDCQNNVKQIFADKKYNQLINNNGYQFSSANSINWGRLVPQIAYYFAGYLYLIKRGVIEAGEEINFTVPTGNFGNILAGYYASRMGLPVRNFICASNENNILTDFLENGEYDINRDFKKTISPSMDILISSNLERFLFEITGHDAEKINHWYSSLRNEGKFKIDKGTHNRIKSIFKGEYSKEEETKEAIKNVFTGYDYLLDPHTGVGFNSYIKYRSNNNDNTTTIIDSTANPYKFSRAVLEAVTGEIKNEDHFKILKRLKNITGTEVHRALTSLNEKDVKHKRRCDSSEIRKEIKDILNIENWVDEK